MCCKPTSTSAPSASQGLEPFTAPFLSLCKREPYWCPSKSKEHIIPRLHPRTCFLPPDLKGQSCRNQALQKGAPAYL